MTKKRIQIGITAARDPETGEFLPAVPIYAEATPELVKQEEKVHRDIAKVFADKMKQYIDGGGMIKRCSDPHKQGGI